MKQAVILLMTGLLLVNLLAGQTFAQKGMGEPTGVGRQAVKPDGVSLSGKLTAIKTGPCKKTRGRALLGTRILIEPEQGKQLNVHLGPAALGER